MGVWNLLANYYNQLSDITTAISYIGSYTRNSQLTSYDFSPIASSGPGLVVVSVHSEAGGSDPSPTVAKSPSGVTIGGVAATLAVVANSSATGATSTSIWYAEVISSVSSVNVTYSTAPVRVAIGVHVITRYASSEPVFTGLSADATFPVSRSVTTSVLTEGSSVVAAHTSGNVTSHTWATVTEVYDTLFGASGFTGPTGASLLTVVQDALTITVTEGTTPTQSTSLAVAVWR